MVFAADVYSAFDIAWYTFARLLAEDPSLESNGSGEKCKDGILICCHHYTIEPPFSANPVLSVFPET